MDQESIILCTILGLLLLITGAVIFTYLKKPVDSARKEPEDPNALVAVFSTQDYVQAEMLKLRLDSFGIDSVVKGEITTRTIKYPDVIGHLGGGIQLMVRRQDAERAIEIIQNS